MKIKTNLLLYFIISLITLSLLSLASITFLMKNNEHLSIKSIVSKQIHNKDVIYSSAINLDYKNYILEKYKITKPDILILGSSEAQYYPQYLFQRKMMIAQQPFYSFEMFLNSLEELIKIHKPKIIILGIDWWLFNKKYNEKQSKIFNKALNSNLNTKQEKNKKIYNYSFNEVLKPYYWIITKKISVKFFIKTIFSESKQNIGVMANVHNSGYDFSGYFVDNFSYSGKKKYDLKFRNTILQIKNKKKDFSFLNLIRNH